ncbi:MAG: DUF3267 domain-containing protein [Anaerolineae bacterium]|nr:DUF3267 domain-containing protein [Anaerolineae bacterium]
MVSLPPAPPAGYRPAVRFEYPMRSLHIISIVALVASFVGFGFIATQAQGRTLGELFSLNIFQILIILLLLPATILIHELMHGVTYQLLGYQVSYGIAPELGAAYAAAFGQFQQRQHNLIVALMPLLVITGIGVIAMTIPATPFLAAGAFVVLLINTSGAVGDVYITWRLLKMPPRTLLYDVSAAQMLIFEPASP